MRILFLIMCSILVAAQVFCVTPCAYSQELNYELSGVIYEQPTLFDIEDDSLLNPNNEILDISDWNNRFYGRISFDLHFDDFKFITQTRPSTLLEENEEEADFIVDDAYLDMGIGENTFFYIGKKNIRDLVAYGANPIDFLGEDKELDYTKREEERWVERKGNYLVGLETFLSNITLSATYAPEIDDWQDEEDRLLLRGNLFVESLNTDMSLQAYLLADIPGVGFTVSSTLSDNLVLHTECAFREGSARKKEITAVNIQDLDDDDDDDIYPHIVVGGSYTFGDGTNLTCEYIYNGDGYSSSEWDEFIDFVTYWHDEYTNALSAEDVEDAAENLAQANSIMHVREMRKNYVFLRLSNSKLIQDLDAQLVFIVNADDGSFLAFPTIDYNLATNLVLGLSATAYSGDDDSEFGMMYWKSQVSLLLKYYF